MRWIRRLRVISCFAEMTQQIHLFRASGVKSFQAACVFVSEVIAMRKSVGFLCNGAGLPVLRSFIVTATILSI